MNTPPGDPATRFELTAERAADVATVAKGGTIQIVGQVIHRSLSFLFTILAVRALGPAGFGLYQVVVQLLEFLSQLGLLGFNHAVVRFVARARVAADAPAVRGTIRVAFLATAVVSGTIVLVVLIAADPIARAFGGSSAEQAYFALLLRIGIVFVPFFACMQVFRYGTQAYKTMVPSVWVGNITQPLLRLLFAAVLLFAGFGVSALIAGDVISMGVAAVLSIVFFKRILSEEERIAVPRADVGAIVRFALPQSGAGLLGIQTLGLGVILLGLFSSNEQAGLFAIALALQGPADLTLSGVINIWSPMVTDLHDQGAIERLDSLFKTITRWIATLSLPVSAAIALEAELFARILGGDAAVEAAPVVAILALGNVFYTCTGPTASLLSMSGRPGINFLDSLVALVLYSLLGWLVVGEHGAVGMAWVHTGVTAAINLTRVVQGKMLVGVQPFGRSLLKPLGATGIGVVLLLVWKAATPDTIPMQVAGLVLGSLAYLGVLKVLGVDEEERYVWGLMKQRVSRLKQRR